MKVVLREIWDGRKKWGSIKGGGGEEFYNQKTCCESGFQRCTGNNFPTQEIKGIVPFFINYHLFCTLFLKTSLIELCRWVFLKSRTLVSVDDEGPEPEAPTTISVSITEDKRGQGTREDGGSSSVPEDSNAGKYNQSIMVSELPPTSLLCSQ
jgi:hypothetical protein